MQRLKQALILLPLAFIALLLAMHVIGGDPDYRCPQLCAPRGGVDASKINDLYRQARFTNWCACRDGLVVDLNATGQGAG